MFYPYGHGHLILQPNENPLSGNSESSSRVRSIGEIINDLIYFTVRGNQGSIPKGEQWEKYFEENLTKYIFATRILITQKVETVWDNGSTTTELYLKPLCFWGAEARDVSRVFNRLTMDHFLSQRTTTTHELDLLHDLCSVELQTELPKLEHLCELAAFGERYTNLWIEKDGNGDREGVKTAMAKIKEINELIISVANNSYFPSALGFYSANLLSRTEGLSIEWSKEIFLQEYRNLQTRVMTVLDLTKELFHNLVEGRTSNLGAP
jgi:hypothetical protein